MQSIAEWLEEVGLGEYAQCFAENGIDFSILDHLSDGDLAWPSAQAAGRDWRASALSYSAQDGSRARNQACLQESSVVVG